ncbi:MAG: DUF4298 domain-containing protein [Clostridia bacterium]|nr:DUF4298 domain-containing protein [Clostridia bacterium]MBR1704881.1 DUF4298 domain-containing protein [Clostridia bacterium]
MDIEKTTPGEKEQQVKRIEQMEAYLNDAKEAVKKVSAALEDFMEAQNKVIALENYYEGGCWRKDFEDDEKGLLPDYLKRGVLSEDAIYDLLTDNDELLAIISMDEFEKRW